jgi:GTP-binding protein
VLRGTLNKGDAFNRIVSRWTDSECEERGWETALTSRERAVHFWVTRGLNRVETDTISAGDIVWLSGPEQIGIGDTLSADEESDAGLQPLEIEEPTLSMLFLVNNGPFSGQDGKAIMLRQLRERLERELHTNVAMRMEDVGRADGVKVSGRGELHLAILIEEMRREGLEFCISRPEVITHENADGRVEEPMEQLVIDTPDQYQGVIIEKLAARKGELLKVENGADGQIRLEFEIPTRGLFGYRTEFLTDTRGLGVMASRFVRFDTWRGDIVSRNKGSVISMETGPATAYSIESLQERATIFIEPTEKVYAGQIVGENTRPDELPCNPTKRKQLTNHRSSTKEIGVTLSVPRKLTLEQAMEWIRDDELVEVTPGAIRVRKAILDPEARKRAVKRQAGLPQKTLSRSAA